MTPNRTPCVPALASCIVLSLAAGWAQAQTSPAKPTREQVRKEATAANKADKIEHGEVDHTNPVPAVRKSASGVTTGSVKREAVAANKAGTIEHGEMGSSGDHPKGKPTSDRSRADVKKDAVAANKAGQISRGEVEPPPKR